MTGDEQPRKKRNTTKGISRTTVTQRHPLNVKPAGNALIFSSNALAAKKTQLLGKFANFPDELLLELISYLDNPGDLLRLSHVSRIFYAFLYDEDIWRKLYLRKCLEEEAKHTKNFYPLNISQWRGSWKRTLLNLPKNQESKIQLPENLLCSDVLFRPYQCSQINYQDLLADMISNEKQSYELGKSLNTEFGIERVDEESLDTESFNKNYLNRPFILNAKPNRWPDWKLSTLTKRFHDVKFRQEAIQWPLALYAQYFEENSDESPLYLFDCQSTAMAQLVQEYKVPEIFEQDLFTLFNNNATNPCRPDYRWLIAGPERSGSTFHKDPNATCAWNANLSGSKLWIMLPPHIKPPGVGTDDEESEVTSPVGVAEWMLSGFFSDSLRIAKESNGRDCLIGITFSGECMFVPSGWWHTVVNLEDSVAITQNFVPVGKLGETLNFLKHKRDQISGFHVVDFVKSLEAFLNSGNTIDEKDSKIFNEFLNEIKELQNSTNNEDIGELRNVPYLPIYEFLVELIKNSEEFKDLLPEALEAIKHLEFKESQKEERHIVASKVWDELVKPAEDSAAFSFNFNDSDDN